MSEETNHDSFDSTRDNTQNTASNQNEDWNRPHTEENKKLIAGILAIVIGSLGIHKFILGYTQEGVLQIIITIVTCGLGGIIGLIEGIIYLTKSDEEFYQTYQVGKRGWF